MINCILIRYGEIYIRGKNKVKFENMLIEIIEKRLTGLSNYKINKDQGRIIIESTDNNLDYEYIISKLKFVSGIVSFSPCFFTEDFSIDNIRKLSLDMMNDDYKENITFKVQAKRALKKYPLNSQEIGYDVGGYILNMGDRYKVDVKTPEVTLYIEIRSKVYIYSKIIKGINGLPYGSSGKGVLLLSGGIDSPVAGYLMAKRGLAFEAIYFHSPPFTSINALIKVKDLCEKLSEFTSNIKLHVINFTEIQLYINNIVHENKTTIFLKRAMLKTAEKLALELNAKGLIVGDSMGQVASQTMESIFVINSATQFPILRPLIAMDKEEIINIAKNIETYEISIRPFEDCCTIFVPKHPDLKPTKKIVEILNSRLVLLDDLIDKALSQKEEINFDQ